MIKFLIEKEFKQIRRDSFMPKMIILMPVIMLLLLPWAANQEIKDINLSIVDHDHSPLSQRLLHKVTSSGYFRLTDVSQSNEEALASIEAGKADVILEIQPDFEKNLVKDGIANVMISANSVNGVKGGLSSSYLSSIMADYANEIRSENVLQVSKEIIPAIEIIPMYKFNPHLDYKVFMIPAIMAMLITLITGFLPALNIVSEKEKGTIEQINVTPVKKTTFIIAKLIPYWIIGFIVLTICFGLAILIYGLSASGSILTIYLFTGIYILVVSGIGLVISNHSSTMQQAMFVMFFFLMIMFMMSGLFTPISSMPEWAQVITEFNPLTYFIEVMRMVYLKGSILADLSKQMIILIGFAFLLNTWAVLSYRKSS